MIEVVCALIEKDNKILIAKRIDGEFAGKWEFPGGKVDIGETKEIALKREIKEELDLVVDVDFFISNDISILPTRTISLSMFKCTYISGDIKIYAHTEFCWVKKEDVLKYDLIPVDRRLIEGYLKGN